MFRAIRNGFWLFLLMLPSLHALALSAPVAIPLPFNHLYLRCNATDWQLSSRSRLQKGENPGELTLTFDVKEPWMLQSGDSCLLTETALIDQWGSWQRHYSATQPRLLVPDSSSIQLRPESEPLQFRLIYPELGRYRVTYHVQDAFFSIEKLGPIQAGETAWSLPGSLVLDAQQRLFLQTDYPSFNLLRIDPETGREVWKHRAGALMSFQQECNDENSLLLLERGSLFSLDSDTGQERWHYDLRGEPPFSNALISCPSGSDLVFLIHGAEHSQATALKRGDGHPLWNFKGDRNLSVQGREREVLYLSSFDNQTSRLKGLDLASGRELWTRVLPSAWFSYDQAGALYLLDGSTLQRVDSASGQALWTYRSPSEWIYLNFEQGRTIVTEKDRLLRIDPEQGRTLWTWDMKAYFGQPAFATVLPSGDIYVRSPLRTARGDASLLLDGAEGQVLWQGGPSASESFLTQASMGEAFRIDGTQLSSLDLRSGAENWTYRGPPTQLLSQVIASEQQVFASFTQLSRRDAPMGTLAFDRKSGQLLWQNLQNQALALVGTLPGFLFINVGVSGGSAKAIRLH